MTTMTLTPESRQIALDLHALLNDLEPARWKDEKLDELRARLQDIQLRMESLLDAWAEDADLKFAAMRTRYNELCDMIGDHHSSPEPGTLHELRDAWMSFRARAEPAYEALAASMKANDLVVPSLRPSNYTRNIFHVLAAGISLAVVELLPALLGAGFWVVAVAAGVFAISGWTMELARHLSPRANALMMSAFKHVSHPHEAHHINSSTWYVTALFLLSLTGQPLVCAVALGVLGFADPAAAIVGKRWGRIRFENGRSLEGTTTFVVVGGLTALGVMVAFHPGELSFARLLLLCFGAALAGGVAELYSRRIDDNLSIPLAAGAAALAMLAWML